MNSNLYKIIKFKKTQLPEIIKLYKKAYGRTKSASYFEYRLLNSPYGKPIIFLMKFQKEIIGFYAIHPIKLCINNKSVLGGYSYLTMTHPNYTGKGIFTKLANKTFDEAKKRKFRFIYGFANKNSFPGFIKNLGFKQIKPINYLGITLKKLPISNLTGIDIQQNPPKKIWFDYNLKNKFHIFLDRNEKFLNWRYHNHPFFKYKQILISKNYFFIFKKYEKTLHIVDFFGNDKFYDVMLSEAARQAKKLKCNDITFWIPKKHQPKTNYKFKKIIPKSYFIVKVLDKKYKILENINNWYYTMGDADVF